MPKIPKNHEKPWTRSDDALLRKLVRENTPTRVMGLKLDRTVASVRSHAQREHVSLKPTNQSPYTRR